jgi:DNA invertase Pin-like site-specific DNA recombinase
VRRRGIAQAREEGRPHGRPATVARQADQVKTWTQKGLSTSAIAKQLNSSRTPVRRLLGQV